MDEKSCSETRTHTFESSPEVVEHHARLLQGMLRPARSHRHHVLELAPAPRMLPDLPCLRDGAEAPIDIIGSSRLVVVDAVVLDTHAVVSVGAAQASCGNTRTTVRPRRDALSPLRRQTKAALRPWTWGRCAYIARRDRLYMVT
jgi:hypothetical protein